MATSDTSRYFCFRWDVDTKRCLVEGVPNLSQLGQEMGVEFTFFINMGRAISFFDSLKALLHRSGQIEESAVHLSARQKLGLKHYCWTALINPLIGSRHKRILSQLSLHHEVGVHGGRNHEVWHRKASSWSFGRLKEEVSWSTQLLREAGIEPIGFSCPGWTSHSRLTEILIQHGYTYRADVYGHDNPYQIETHDQQKLLNLSTNLVGMPGGVAYLENLRARGFSDSKVIETFKRDLQGKKYAAVYDHPYYAGIKEQNIVRKLVEVAQEEGFEILPFRKLVQRFSNEIEK